jgi:hypothetical protein
MLKLVSPPAAPNKVVAAPELIVSFGAEKTTEGAAVVMLFPPVDSSAKAEADTVTAVEPVIRTDAPGSVETPLPRTFTAAVAVNKLVKAALAPPDPPVQLFVRLLPETVVEALISVISA